MQIGIEYKELYLQQFSFHPMVTRYAAICHFGMCDKTQLEIIHWNNNYDDVGLTLHELCLVSKEIYIITYYYISDEK